MSDQDELDRIRQRRLAELQNRAMAQKQAQLQAQMQQKQAEEFEQKKNALMLQILTSDARIRLQNIKMVRPDFAQSIELQLIQLFQQGVLQRNFNLPMTDEEFKAILQRAQKSKKDRNIRIM